MSQSKSTNKPSSQPASNAQAQPELPSTGTNVTFFVARGKSGRYFATPASWKKSQMSTPSGASVEIDTVQNAQDSRTLPANCPSSLLLPETFVPTEHGGSLAELRINWNSESENTVLFAQS